MSVFATIVPSLTILALTLITALPWGLSSQHRFFLPHLVYAAIHYFALRHQRQLPEIVAFLSGLGLDVLTGGPLGYWPLVFLAGYAIAVLQAPWVDAGRGGRWGLMIIALLLLSIFEWALASLYYLELADWRPIALGAAGVGLVYPVLALLLHAIDAPLAARPHQGR
jgi:rod shape-determining protein MreD